MNTMTQKELETMTDKQAQNLENLARIDELYRVLEDIEFVTQRITKPTGYLLDIKMNIKDRIKALRGLENT